MPTKAFTSITLENYHNEELAEEIVNYLKKKKIKQVKIKITEELRETLEKNYTTDKFDKLKDEIQRWLEADGFHFYLSIPKIKTTFEKFAYGVEANSYEKDFKETFSKYE